MLFHLFFPGFSDSKHCSLIYADVWYFGEMCIENINIWRNYENIAQYFFDEL